MAGNTPAVSTGAKDFGTISANQGAVIGDVSGCATVIASQTNNNFQYPGRPDTPPNPSSNIPFRRDPDFVDRGTLLDEIHTKCSAPASRVALVGLGGVGKSQLAIQYCYEIREKWPETWIFWVHASNAARIEQGYRDIAEQVKIPGRQDPKADIFQLVTKWLRDENNGKWALVLDSADDVAVLFKTYATSQEAQTSGSSGGRTQSPLAYLPQSLNGSILVTTRTKNVALQLVEENDLLFVEPMDNTHALTLLEKKLGKEMDRDDTARLAAALEFMPLAIVQAAAYIRQRVPRYSVRRYVEDFYKNDKKKTSLLNHEAGHLRRDLEAKNSIIITWQISFDHIRQIRPSAANLLSLMSFCDRQGIPETLLKPRNAAKNKNIKDFGDEKNKDKIDDSDEDAVSNTSVDDDFEADIHTLRNYSFITTSIDGTTFEMHGLVQLAARTWLEAHDQLERWRQQYIRNLWTVYPTGNYKNWTKCQAFFPHAKSAVAQQPATESSLQEWASIIYYAAWYAWAKGSYVEAEMMALKATKTRKNMFGPENTETLNSMSLLALVYRYRGQWKKAEELDLQVMETRKRVLGAEHPHTLTSMGNLASIYMNQGRCNEAEELEVQVMETRKRVLGAEHPDTLTSIGNLASIYMNQGRWNEAEELEVQVMETRKRVLGAEHPDTLTSMANLATTYWSQGRWNEAEELEVQVMETSKRVLGAEHPDTLTSIGNLASIYMNQGRWNEAEELEVQVMETRKRVLETEHPGTLTSMANLATTYWSQGRWNEAEELGVQVMETSKRVLGAEHPDTLTSMGNLALTYMNQGRWNEAEELGVQVMETSKRMLGTEHPDTLTSIGNLASIYKNQGRWNKAEELGVQVMETSKRVLGAEHPDTLTSIGNLASIYKNQGRCNEAEELEVQVMETRKRVLGPEHPETLASIISLAVTWKSQGRNHDVLSLLRESSHLREQELGTQDPYAEVSLELLNHWQMESSTATSQNDSYLEALFSYLKNLTGGALKGAGSREPGF